MIQHIQSPPKLDLLEAFSDCLSLDVAQRIVDFRLDDKSQERIDQLAEKCNEGTLSTEERADYEYYVRIIYFIGSLQAKARLRLKATAGRA